MEKGKNWIIEAAVIAVGLIVLGFCIKGGIDNFVNKDRRVTVKGLSEMEVPADKVTWPIVTKETGNNLHSLYEDINHKNSVIVTFLKQNGLTDKEIEVNAPQVNDRNANDYSSERASERYNVTSVVTVTSNQVDKVRAIMAKQGELLKQGVAIVQSYDNAVNYEYTSFRDIKPKMMDEAIENAKKTADQFAQKCGSRLNKIESADQGVFSINDRDEHTPYIKSLRVVSTITYSLKD